MFHAYVICLFFKINFFQQFLQEYHQSFKQFGSRSDMTFVGPDLGPNCLQRLSADDTSKQLKNQFLQKILSGIF